MSEFKGQRTIADLLGSTKPASFKKIDHNTIRWFDGNGCEHVRLHDTDIITILPNGRIRFYTDGYQTVTTKDRLNKFADGFRFWSVRGQMFVCSKAGDFPFVENAEFFIKSGRPCKPSLHNAETAKFKRERKLIDRFIVDLRKGFSLNGKGDPWVQPNESSGLYDRSYVIDWLRSRYIFPTLVFNAHKAAGFTNESAALYLHTMASGEGPLASMGVNRVRRYLGKCLGHAV